MTHSQIVTAHRMVGSVIPDTLIASRIITLMLRVGFVPLTSIVTCLRDRDQTSSDLADQLRAACKSKQEKRISYIIFDGQICSPILNWKWRKYTGANKHTKHMHVSFKKAADNDGAFYQIPMLGGE